MTALVGGFAAAIQQVRFLFFDLLWKFIWLVVTAIVLLIAGIRVMDIAGAIEWNGPDLGGGNPIILAAAYNELLRAIAPTVLVTVVGVLVTATVLWLILESLFRGGRKEFWVYLVSGLARVTVLGGMAVLLGAVVVQGSGGGGLGMIAVVTLAGLWFLVAIAEVVIRRDAVELVARNLIPLAASVGFLLLLEVFFAVLIWGGGVTVLLMSSNSSEVLLGIGLLAALAVPWTILHSYLVLVRFSMVDIMRRNVVDG
jgi:hypothetical protein